MDELEKLTLNSYLSFKLGDEIFASNVSKVLNILEMMKITKVPKAPTYMKGVINLRGTVLPVVDTRLKFGMLPIELTTNTCILVLDVKVDEESVHIGAIVDSVQEVLEFGLHHLKILSQEILLTIMVVMASSFCLPAITH